MDVKINIPDWLKIPLYILLPASWMFGGLILFLPNKILQKINILSWRNENGFIIGILFLVATCLMIIYVLCFFVNFIGKIYFKLTIHRRTIKRICKMNDMERTILLKMYNMPGYTMDIDFNHPITKALLARNYVYTGNNQIVSMDVYTNEMPIKVTLQPFVYQAFDYLKAKMKREICKLEKYISKEKDIEKSQQKTEELIQMKETYTEMYGESC